MQGAVFLGRTSLTGGAVAPIPIPCVNFYSRFVVRLTGDIVSTFASGTPVARADGIINSLFSSIQVIADGKREIKNVMPWLVQMQNFVRTGQIARRGSVAGATSTFYPKASGTFVYGATTNITSVIEEMTIHFAYPFAKNKQEQNLTLLNANACTTLEMRFNANPYSSLLSAANTAPVTYSGSTLAIELYGIPDWTYGPKDDPTLFDYRQTTNQLPFTGAGQQQFQLLLRAATASLWFYAVNGAAGSATTATDRVASDDQFSQLNVKKNGRDDDFNISWTAAKDDMINHFGVNAPYASSLSLLDGINCLSYVKDSIYDALDTKDPKEVSSLYLYATGAAAPPAVYTNTSYLNIMQDLISPIQKNG